MQPAALSIVKRLPGEKCCCIGWISHNLSPISASKFRRQMSVGLTMTSAVPPDGASLHRYPGTSCLATISLSLRDKSHSPIPRATSSCDPSGQQELLPAE